MIKMQIKIRMNCSDIPYSKRKLQAPIIVPDKDNRISAILFTCIPGNKPVAIPVITPRTQNTIINRRSIMIQTHLEYVKILCASFSIISLNLRFSAS